MTTMHNMRRLHQINTVGFIINRNNIYFFIMLSAFGLNLKRNAVTTEQHLPF